MEDKRLYKYKTFDGKRKDMDWLMVARNAFDRLATFRRKRKECKDYAYGRQYASHIVVNGRKMTKEAYLEEKGIPPLQTNILGKIKRVVQGQYRLNGTAPVCNAPDPDEKDYADIMSALLRQNMQLNDREELDARTFEEYLISGFPCYKISWAYRKGKLDVWQDYVNPNFVFWPYTLDFKMEDIPFCGMLHDMDFKDVLAFFSHSDEDEEELRKIYINCQNERYLWGQYGGDIMNNKEVYQTDFFTPLEPSKCRVIELWTKEARKSWFCDDPLEPQPYYIPYDEEEEIKKENQRRRSLNLKRNADGSPMIDSEGNMMYFIDPQKYEEDNLIRYERRIETYWYFRYLSPDGYILQEGMSPYWNGGESFHPFVFKPYPFIDGEVHPFIAEMIPSQDYFNYYLIALDFYVKNAAKGVLMIDEESLSDNMSIEDIAENYVKTNGVIIYTSKKGGRAPETKTAGTIPGGFDYFIQLSRTLIEDVSGAQAALQGKSERQQSAALNQQLVMQASASILDLLRSYNNFLKRVAMKVIKVMQCFYSGAKTISIGGQTIPYNMDTMYDVDLDVSISDDQDGPVYRMLMNQFLMNFVDKGQIPLEVALKAGNFANSTKILNLLDEYKKDLQSQQQQGVLT